MRPLSLALADAVRAGAAAPLVRLELLDTVPHYAPIVDSGPLGRNAAVVAGDGAVAQAYLDEADGARPVYARRVPDPADAPWDTAWMSIGTGADPGAGVALARLDDRLRLLWQDGHTTAVRAADSFDGGATWAAPVALFDPAARLAALAADGTLGTGFVAYAAGNEGGGGGGGGTWRVAAWSLGGAWRGADWTGGDLRAVAGLHAVRRDDGSYLLALAAQTNSGPGAGAGAGTALLVCAYAGSWGAPLTLVPPDASASDASGLRLAEPRLAHYDDRYHLAYSVVDAGAPSPLATARVALMHSADGVHWTDPLEDAGTYAYGATPLRVPAGYLLVAPDAAALAPPYLEPPGAGRYADLSAAVSRLEIFYRDGLPARLVATAQVRAADIAPLRPNAMLRLSLGYIGAGMAPAGLFFIDDWSALRAVDEDETVITASDRTAWLDRQSRATALYEGRTVEWLVREVAARAGLLLVDAPATAQFAYTAPAFAVAAGSTWREALARLGRLYGFDAAMRLGPDGEDALALCEKSPADGAVWTYRLDMERLVTARTLDRANHVIVFGAANGPGAADVVGAGVVGEAWDWTDVSETGQERYLHAIETLITTREGAALRAELELRRESRLGRSGSLSAPLHPGLEPWDVIALGGGEPSGPATVTTAATLLRVAAVRYIYEPGAGAYDMALTLEGV